VIGGARGLGFFPSQWQPPLGDAIAQVTHAVKALGPALLAPEAPASADGSVRVTARAYGGALYVIAVNQGSATIQARVNVAGLAGRPLAVLDEGRQVQSNGDLFTDSFAPLGAHVYVVAP
jgi:hypothetical protein